MLHRVRSVGTAVVMGVMFGLVLVILVVAQGVENVVLKYAQDETKGKVYLVSDYDGNNGIELILERINRYNGKIVTLTSEELGDETETLEGGIVVEFDSVKKAFEYYEKSDAADLHYKKEDYRIEELFGNQMAVYGYFREINGNVVEPVTLVLMVVAGVIFVLTGSHALSQNMKTLALYRALGASKKQILMVDLMYLIGLCGLAISVALLVALVMSGAAALLGWDYLRDRMMEVYPGIGAVGMPILMGWNLKCLEVIACMILCVPLTLVLSLDQFTMKRLAWQLKGD